MGDTFYSKISVYNCCWNVCSHSVSLLYPPYCPKEEVVFTIWGTGAFEHCWHSHLKSYSSQPYLYKIVKRFQMKSTACRDVQHTGLQSTQTRRNYSSNNTGKQGAQTRGFFKFPSIPTSAATTIYEYTNVHVKAYGIQTKWCRLQA